MIWLHFLDCVRSWAAVCSMQCRETWLINAVKSWVPERIKYRELTSSCSVCFSLSDDSFNLGLTFELVMEVRPRVASGVLMHLFTADGFITMYTHQGAVSYLQLYRKLHTQCIVFSKAWTQFSCFYRLRFLWTMELMSSPQRYLQGKVCVLATGTELQVRIFFMTLNESLYWTL